MLSNSSESEKSITDKDEAVVEEISEVVRDLEPIQRQMIRMLVIGYIAGHNQKSQKFSETA